MAIALFVLVAIPGLVVFLASLLMAFLATVQPDQRTWVNMVGAPAGICMGSVAMLVGTQRWGRWLHLLVLLLLPAVFVGTLAVLSLLEVWRFMSPMIGAAALSTVVGLWAVRWVDRYYRKRAPDAPAG